MGEYGPPVLAVHGARSARQVVGRKCGSPGNTSKAADAEHNQQANHQPYNTPEVLTLPFPLTHFTLNSHSSRILMYRFSSLVRTSFRTKTSPVFLSRSCLYYSTTMAGDNSGSAADKSGTGGGMREIKILMLHGKRFTLTCLFEMGISPFPSRDLTLLA